MEEVNDYPFEYWKYTQESTKSNERGSFEEMTENKMGQVAALFGERLNQDFKIKHLKLYFRFTEEGLMLWEKEAGHYLPAPHDVFIGLLQGKREIEHKEGDCR